MLTSATPLPPLAYDDLVAKLIEADRLYYDAPDEDSDARLPDHVYDGYYDMLVEMEKHREPALNSPTQRVQGSATLAPTRHATPMYSLAKITEDEKDSTVTWREVEAFLNRVGPSYEFSIEPKLDGASLSLEYEGGRLVRALTRGDGTTGDDVTQNAKLIRGVPTRVDGEYSGWVRGEVVIHLDDFDALNVPDAKGKEPFANARNAAAGALRHSDPREARRRRLTFYAYDAEHDGPVLDSPGLLRYDSEVGCGHIEVQGRLGSMLGKRARGYFPFETDGIVIKVVSKSRRRELGVVGKTPKWSVAYKTKGEVVQTVVEDIVWRTGPGGTVAPRVRFKPARCGGTKITWASAHNQVWMREKGIKVGALVEIRRMGDTIPGVERVVDAHPALPDFQAPLVCSACDSALVSSGERGQVKCPNQVSCPPQQVGRLVKWASRDAADIDSFGPAWIEALVAAGKLRDASDVYKLTVEDLAPLERVDDKGSTRRLGEKMAAKIVANIAGAKNVGMRRALIGMGIPQVSEGTAKRLTAEFECLERVEEATLSKLASIADIGEGTARCIWDFFDAYKYLVYDLREQGVNLDRLPEDEPVDTSDGYAFVVTGSVPGYASRKEFEALLERKGWIRQSSVSAKTDYLILDDPDSTSSKAKKARDLGVSIITPAQAAELAGLVAA